MLYTYLPCSVLLCLCSNEEVVPESSANCHTRIAYIYNCRLTYVSAMRTLGQDRSFILGHVLMQALPVACIQGV